MRLSQNYIFDKSDVDGVDPGGHNRVVRVLNFVAPISILYLNSAV